MPQQMLRCMLTHVKVLRCIVDDNNKEQMPTYRAYELDEKGHVVGPPVIIVAFERYRCSTHLPGGGRCGCLARVR